MSATPDNQAEPQAGAQPPVARRAMRGAIFTMGGHATVNVIRLASNLVLTRLLVPEHFGLMALVNVFLQGFVMFSDVGIRASIIRSEREDEVFLQTAWSIQAIRGVLLLLATAAFAWPVSIAYDAPELTWMLPVAGTSALLDGLVSIAFLSQNRALVLGRVTLIEVIGALASVVTMVITAWFTRSVVSLLVGGIAAAFVRVLLSHTVLPSIRLRFSWDREACREIFSFGRWVFAGTAVTFLAQQLDRLLLGKYVSKEDLGIYSIGLMLALMPRELASQVSHRVYFPLVSEFLRVDEGPRVRALRPRLLALVVVPIACVIAVAVPIVEFVYDSRYHAAGEVMRVLSFDSWLAIVAVSYGEISLGSGHPKYSAYGQVAKVVIFGLFFYWVFASWGILGVVGLVCAATVGSIVVTAYGAFKLKLSRVDLDLAMTAGVLGLSWLFGQLYDVTTNTFGHALAGIGVLFVIAVGVPLALLLGARARTRRAQTA